jgi:excisionase family DNA binding protein
MGIKRIEGNVARIATKNSVGFSNINSEGEEELTLTIEGHKEKLALKISSNIASAIMKILEEIEQGKTIMVIGDEDEITTQEAADLLHVSRPYLINLLENKEIPYRRVGRYRRLKASDVLNYKKKVDEQRQLALDELTALAQELDLGY